MLQNYYLPLALKYYVNLLQCFAKSISFVIILLLSWALTSVTQDLGFNNLINQSLIRSIPKLLIPAILFLISGIVSYTIRSSWATWALIMPLSVNFSLNFGVNISLMIGTVWAGGAVADIISPLSAQMADTSFGKHLTTSFSYVITGVLLTAVAYIAVGFLHKQSLKKEAKLMLPFFNVFIQLYYFNILLAVR